MLEGFYADFVYQFGRALDRSLRDNLIMKERPFIGV